MRKICSVKITEFWFKINSFPCLLVVSALQIWSHLLWPDGRHVTSKVWLSLALVQSPTQKVSMNLVVKLQVIQQLTTLMTFFKTEECSHRSIGTELVYFSIIALLFFFLLLLYAK